MATLRKDLETLAKQMDQFANEANESLLKVLNNGPVEDVVFKRGRAIGQRDTYQLCAKWIREQLEIHAGEDSWE